MKFSVSILIALLLSAPAALHAAGDGKARGRRVAPSAGAESAAALKPFDTNGNRKIDADELPALQQAFAALNRLDKNANHEIEPGELEAGRPAAAGEMRSRVAEAFKRVDKNGNRKIDADEIDALQQMLAKGPSDMMKKLDQNGNGKLEEGEVARLNERLANLGAGRSPAARPSGTPGFRRPPEKSPEATKPAETVKPAEKPAVEEEKPKQDKPETPPNKFGS